MNQDNDPKKQFVRTIVGGRDDESPDTKVEVSVGIERVLYLASTDPDFFKALLNNRPQALTQYQLNLSESEARLLTYIENPDLITMVQRFKPPKPERRDFMKAVAATFVTISAGSALNTSCTKIKAEAQKMAPGGIRPDLEENKDKDKVKVQPKDMTAGGIRPEAPKKEPPTDAGINDGGTAKDAGVKDAGAPKVSVPFSAPLTKGIRPK